MDPIELINFLLRWIHFLTGITWIEDRWNTGVDYTRQIQSRKSRQKIQRCSHGGRRESEKHKSQQGAGKEGLHDAYSAPSQTLYLERQDPRAYSAVTWGTRNLLYTRCTS